VGQQQRQIGHPGGQRLAGQQGGGRGGGLKAHRQHHHLAIGMGSGQGQGLQRGGEQTHITAGGTHPQQVVAAAAARHPQHVAVRTKHHVGPEGQLQGAVDRGHGRDAHRTARTMDQLQARRQQLVEAGAHDRVGLAAADLHQGPGAGDTAGQRRRQRRHLGGVGSGHGVPPDLRTLLPPAAGGKAGPRRLLRDGTSPFGPNGGRRISWRSLQSRQMD
jgi:hypothetical protein